MLYLNSMFLQKLINPANTAVLVIDIQNDYCSERGKLATMGKLNVQPIQRMIPKLTEFVDTARRFNLPIIFTQMIEDPKYMNENAILKIKSAKKPFVLCSPKTIGFDFYKMKPKKGDTKIIKKSYDAFSNLKLETTLKRRRIKNLIITGVNTAVCVDATLRTGFTKGYNIIIPEDLVSMPKERMYQHNAAIDIWKTIFAHIEKSDEIIKVWEEEYS